MPLHRIRFVLVETSLSANLGGVARAMKTMGLSRLELVAPRQPPDAEAIACASGADELLARAGLHAALPEAIADCRLTIGASARQRTIDWPVLEPPDCARRLLDAARDGDAALVLGRERSGLTNEELARCQALVQIPTQPGFGSLNLAAAAQVLAYEIRRVWRAEQGARLTDAPRDLATAAELEGFHAHLYETLERIGFGDPYHSWKLRMRLRRLFNRARLDRTEIDLVRGILSAVARHQARGAADPESSGAIKSLQHEQ